MKISSNFYVRCVLLLILHREQQNGINGFSLYPNVYAKYSGDLYVGGLFSIRHLNNDGSCGQLLQQDGLQLLSASVFGLKEIKKMKLLPFELGLVALDTCQSPEHAMRQSKDFLRFKFNNVEKTYVCNDSSRPTIRPEFDSFNNVFGIFGAGNSDVSKLAYNYLALIDLPQISYFSTSPEFSSADYPAFFRTIPSDSYAVKVITNLLIKYKWNYVIVLKDTSDYSNTLFNSFFAYTKNISGDTHMCFSKTILVIEKNPSEESLTAVLKKIIEKTTSSNSPKVVLALLSQPTAEYLMGFIEDHQSLDLSHLLWIGTDSWAGRYWDKLSVKNTMLTHSIGIIPRASNSLNFWKFFQSILPSEDDYDPWLAWKFEETCNCQYTNKSEFIYDELKKIRPEMSNQTSCESQEAICAKKVYGSSAPLLNIHFVIDGIFAYAYALKELVPTDCRQKGIRWCLREIKKKLNITTLISVLRALNFTDSTGENFSFFDGRDGIPIYSIVYFNTSNTQWTVIGSISAETETYNINVDESIMKTLGKNLSTTCSNPCSESQAKKYIENFCCWTCTECLTNAIITNSYFIGDDYFANKNVTQQECFHCPKGEHPNTKRTNCTEFELSFVSLSDLTATVIVLLNMVGLLVSIVIIVVIIVFFHTPIIKASSRETSIIILIGTILSFVFSIVLLDKPSKINCYLRWTVPGFCITLCYAAILVKTNRIARIFAFNPFSAKRMTLRFISSISQINIVIIITGMECIVLTIMLVTSDIIVDIIKTDTTKELHCQGYKINVIVTTFLIPFMLLVSTTVYAFKIRKTPDGYNEARNINFLNFANCVVFFTCILITILFDNDIKSVFPLCFLLTLGSYGNLLGLFIPKVYIIIMRPEKNTLISVMSNTRSRSDPSLTVPASPGVFTVKQNNNPNEVLRCRHCNNLLVDSYQMANVNNAVIDTFATKKGSKEETTSQATYGKQNAAFDSFGDDVAIEW